MHVFKVREGTVVGRGGCGGVWLPCRRSVGLEYWGYWWSRGWGTYYLGSVGKHVLMKRGGVTVYVDGGGGVCRDSGED